MTEDFIKDTLDYDGWQAYQKGSEKFKEAVRLGLKLQLIQVDILLKRLDKRLNS